MEGARAAATPRGGVSWPGQLAVAVALALAAAHAWEAAGLIRPSMTQRFVWWPILEERTSWIPWIPVSVLVVWRWGWAFLHWTRAGIYRWIVFPRLRRAAEREVAVRGGVKELAVLAVTYKEDPAITRVVFASIFDELAAVEGLDRPPVLVAVTGADEDDRGIRAERDEAAGRHPPERLAELVLMRGTEGKRRALAAGLEWILAWRRTLDGAFVMMDGDTHLEPGALSRSLPFFRLEPSISALTTDEHVRVRGAGWFADWLHLRHGLRDLYTSSVALSRRLLCLTGRYSVFRADALDRGFIEIVAGDRIDSWLWGRYALLSGDDKSTWYYLLSRGARMLYLPDVAVVTHEIVRGSPVVRAYHNLRRWGGNMVRNSERAIRLGPRRIGAFAWWCLVDQRLSMWTLLVGPVALALLALQHRWDLANGYLLWVIVSRTVRTAPAWVHARRLSPVYTPLSALLDWAAAVVKIYVLFFPAKQFWMNRGNRSLDSTSANRRIRERKLVAGALLGSAGVAQVAFVAWLTGTVQPERDVRLFLRAGGAGGLALAGLALALAAGLAILLAGRIGQGASDA